MSKIRIGLIGCGGIMNRHVQALLIRSDAQIVGLADPSAEQIARLISHQPHLAGLPTFASHIEMFEALALDAVEVASPHTHHYTVVRAALERGLHVLCEKPLTCDSAQARELVELADARGTALLVSYQRHYDPGYRYMKQVISEGGIGQLQSAAVIAGQNWKKNTTGAWRQNPALSGGGMLMDSGSHLVDVLLWLIERPVKRVAALVDNLGTPVDINTTATLDFGNGLQAQLTIVGNLPATWIEDVLIVGTEGVLRYQNNAQHPWAAGTVSHWRGNELVRPLGYPVGTGPDANWLDVIAGTAPNESPGEVAVRVAALTEAIYESSRTGSVITIL